MTKQEFINSVLAEENVLEILPNTDQVVETKGDYEKGFFEVLLNEPQGGKNFRTVWYIRNQITDETNYQTANTINVTKNTYEAKLDALKKYADSNFTAYSIVSFTGENWAEIDAYNIVDTNVVKTRVFVIKQGNNPIIHFNLV